MGGRVQWFFFDSHIPIGGLPCCISGGFSWSYLTFDQQGIRCCYRIQKQSLPRGSVQSPGHKHGEKKPSVDGNRVGQKSSAGELGHTSDELGPLAAAALPLSPKVLLLPCVFSANQHTHTLPSLKLYCYSTFHPPLPSHWQGESSQKKRCYSSGMVATIPTIPQHEQSPSASSSAATVFQSGTEGRTRKVLIAKFCSTPFNCLFGSHDSVEKH